ncbi:MAG TPA: DUF4157 domain-containing protein [Rhizomicrobium sp.]|jgi:LysM repeat protein|nr:DUF4157 domain-containing protein [Rhizomicrobium sp.]
MRRLASNPQSQSTTLPSRPRDTSWHTHAAATDQAGAALRTAGTADLRAHPAFTHGLLQPKLAIGSSNDPLEQEADRIADRVMEMTPPQTQPERGPARPGVMAVAGRVQAKAGAAGSGHGIEAPPLVQDVLSSPGQPLDGAARAFFEPRFGRDFSDVRVHTDERAAETARLIGAHAYAAGPQLVFAQGRYSPDTREGRHLLSHELAHVVQQGPRPQSRIQKKDADPVPFFDGGTNPHAMGSFDTATGIYTVQADKTVYADPTAAFDTLTSIAQRFGTDVATIVRMNGLKSGAPLVGNQKLHILRPTVANKLSSEIVKGMGIANSGLHDMNYPHVAVGTTLYPDGFVNTGYWDPISEPGSSGTPERKSWNFRLKSGKSATEGIDAVFNGPTRLECLSMISAVMARSVRQTIGQKRFDKAFGEDGVANQSLVIGTSESSAFQTSKMNSLLKDQPASSLADLVKGDWVYFWNCKQYHVVHPGGAWGGENAIYEGGGLFSGFGASHKTMDDMNQALWEAYNDGLMLGDGKYMMYAVWKVQKNEQGGPVGIDWGSVSRIDAKQVKSIGK